METAGDTEVDECFSVELAENVTMTPLTKKKGQNRLVMQVNKYIPHFLRIPLKLDKRDLKLFQEDYVTAEQD